MIEAIVLGGAAGAIVEGGKRGLIKSWRGRDQLPPVIKLGVLAVLVGMPALNAGTFADYPVTALATVGAFTTARWGVASVIVLWGRRG